MTSSRGEVSAFIFHRSLRLVDNLGLLEALSGSKRVIPIFCVDPRQATPEKNKYFSPYCLGFMYQSLIDLQKQLRFHGSDLVILYGEPQKVLPGLFKKKKVTKLYMNKDYTPFARKRVTQLERALDDVEIIEVDDYLLYPPGCILTGGKTAYRVYTSFYNASKRKKIARPRGIKKGLAPRSFLGGLSRQKAWKVLEKNSKYSPFYVPGGRSQALKRLRSLPKTQKDYDKCRDYLTYNTTHLSAYIKFGCISIREAWYGFSRIKGGSKVALLRQLIWREFYYHYYIAYPEELEWSKKYPEAKLKHNAPGIVRACFNELDRTGYLHNRGRMILANYILKFQKNYWKAGDKMYARRLVDYDPIVNVGNWRWIEKQPGFKTLKPNAQEKWDRGCPGMDDKIPKGSYTKFWTGSRKTTQKTIDNMI